jgi:hypothetical protein
VRGAGEKLKVENLRVSHTSPGDTWAGIRNGALFLNGVQIGSTATINEDSQSTAYTQFNLGSSMVLETGKDYTLEVRGDVYNTSGAAVVAGSSTVITIAAGSSNVYRMTSLGYIANTAVPANTITAAAGTLVLSKYGAYANQTVTVPQTAYKIGDFRLSSGSTEGVNIDTLTVAINTSVAANLTSNYITNLYVVYGAKTSQIKSTGAASQTWSINEALALNTNMNVAVYATLNSAFTGAASTTLTVSGTSQSSGNAVTSSAVVGQDITQGTGTITAATDASTPVAALAVAGSMPKIGSFKFTTTNDTFTIKDLTVHMNSGLAADAAAITEVVFKDGATELKRQPMNGVNATATGLSIPIGVNGSKVIDVYAQLGSVGTGFAGTGANVGLALESYTYSNSNGVETTNFGVASTSNNMYVYKTKPTITNVALPTTVLTAGTQTVYKFTITADAGGTVAWRKISLSVGTSTPSGSMTVTGWTLYDSANESSALANISAASTTVTGSTGLVDFVSSVDQEVSGSKTYTVKATIGGSPVTGSTVSHSIASGASAHVAPVAYASVGNASSFTWSDEAVNPHTALTADWNNDNLIKNIPTDSLTLTK